MKERISEIPVVATTATQSPANAPLSDEQLADKDFLRKMCTEELAAIVRSNKGDIKGVPAINALWDRLDGKPGQSVHLDAEIRKVTVNCHIRFTDELPPMVAINNQVIDNEE